MKISSIFVGKDASNQEVAVFMFSFLFSDRKPTFELAKERLEQLNGHLHKLKILLDELYILIG